jgi:hypothetical protein
MRPNRLTEGAQFHINSPNQFREVPESRWLNSFTLTGVPVQPNRVNFVNLQIPD